MRVKKFYGLTNQYVFPLVMRDEEICRELIELLFPGRKVAKIRFADDTESIFGKDGKYKQSEGNYTVESEKTLMTGIAAKYIRLDVLFDDGEAWYDIEMQVADQHELPHRIRYYQAMLDTHHLQMGEYYINLKPTFIIFICRFDFFGLDEPVYQFENRDSNLDLPLGDGRYTMVLNTKCSVGKIPDELKPFFSYVKTGTVCNDNFIKKIHHKVESVNDNEELTGVMTIEEDIEIKMILAKREGKAEGEAIGRAEGEAQKALEVARKLKAMGLAAQEISEATGLSKEDIEVL